MNNGYCTDYECSLRNSNGYCTITGCVKEQTLNYSDGVRVVRYVELSAVDFDKTDRIGFITKNGKQVEFVKQMRGKWVDEPNCWYRCSNCGQHYPSIRGYMDYKYCPNCGARMEDDNG